MNQEPEVGSVEKVSLSPKELLEDAIQAYLDSLEPDENGGGFLTGWYLVMEEQNPVSGTNTIIKATKDLQSISTTLGLVTYSDEYYRSRARHER